MAPSDKDKEIGKRIKALAKQRGYQIAKIAMDTGLSEATVSRLNRGISLTKDNLRIIADYYGVSMDFILNGEENAEPVEPTKEFYIQQFSMLSIDNMRILYNIGKEVKMI